MQTILALDLGTQLGWCYWDGVGLTYNRINMTDQPKPFKVFWNFLTQLTQKYPPTILVVEARIYGKSRTKPTQPGVTVWHGALHTFLEVNDKDILVQEVHVMPLRKTMIGKGRATKADICTKASELVNSQVGNHNIADAILLCIYARDYIFT